MRRKKESKVNLDRSILFKKSLKPNLNGRDTHMWGQGQGAWLCHISTQNPQRYEVIINQKFWIWTIEIDA